MEWGRKDGLPLFVHVRMPGVTKAQVRKYIERGGWDATAPKGRWRIALEELPNGIKTKLRDDGEITIAASGGDVTWQQAKGYFHDNLTNTRETADL